MENLYLIIVIVLFVLAISDLIVGVSNDAVNFLNSAIGSKVAKFRVIIIIAALGVLVGATFSSGMMEVARKGIFHPDKFYFSEIIFIFLAVMITDVILLDMFNTYGMPTSTTVSIVFELLGAAVAMSIIKISSSGEGNVAEFINTASAMKIIFGILLSVIISFTVGMIVQAICRTAFAFNYEKSYRYLGGIFGGLSIAAITYFMVIKGAKGSSFLSSDTAEWFKENTGKILLYSFLGWSFVLQLLIWFFRINVLKLIVLIGTFALAMAFAGNDLVNFIGVPLAGFESFKLFTHGGYDPLLSMDGLSAKIPTRTEFLLIAGIVMVITLWFSKKARSVTKTSLDLSRQDEGDERFGSSYFARLLVRLGLQLGESVGRVVPAPVGRAIASRFDQSKVVKKKKDKASFDLLRAAVNLIVAAVLIAIGTSHKLPLSTTYVTFMVAMGTSLADGAWNRESAVYRITGVFTVIGGWFFTAFAAFATSFILVYILHWGNVYAVFGLIVLAVLIVVRTHIIHKKSYKEKEMEMKAETVVETDKSILKKCGVEVYEFLESSSHNLVSTLSALAKSKRKPILKVLKDLEEGSKKFRKIKKKAHLNLVDLKDVQLEYGYSYLNVIDHMETAMDNHKLIIKQVFEHIDNNHKPLNDAQNEELKEFLDMLTVFETNLMNIVKKGESMSDKSTIKIKEQYDDLLKYLKAMQKSNIKHIKKGDFSTKTSLMFQAVMNETKQYITNTYDLLFEYLNYLKEYK